MLLTNARTLMARVEMYMIALLVWECQTEVGMVVATVQYSRYQKEKRGCQRELFVSIRST